MQTRLPSALAPLLRDGRIDAAEALALEAALARKDITPAQVAELASRYVEVIEPNALDHIARLTGAPLAPQARLPPTTLASTIDPKSPAANIEALQRALLALARRQGDGELVPARGVTGVFDADMERVVRRAQRSLALPVTGVADPNTLAAIQQALGVAAPASTVAPIRPLTSPTGTEQVLHKAVAPAAASGPPHEAVAALARDGRIDRDELAALHARVRAGDGSAPSASQWAELPLRYTEALTPDARRYLTSEGHPAPTAQELLPDRLKGRTLKPGAPRAQVEALQRGLMALAREDAGRALPSGATGVYDADTQAAVKALQRRGRRPETGIADPATMELMQAELVRTHRIAWVQPEQPGTSALLAARAFNMAEGEQSKNYGASRPWVNNDPRHALPAGVEIESLAGAWKCNLFVCNAMVASGFEPPYYGNKGTGEYPNANKLYLFSDVHAPRENNRAHFEMREELRLDRVPFAERAARVRALFDTVEPGDLVIVDHPGDAVRDGGHCRIAIDRAWDGGWNFAQAGSGRAAVIHEMPEAFTREQSIWVLRPNQVRR